MQILDYVIIAVFFALMFGSPPRVRVALQRAKKTDPKIPLAMTAVDLL